MWQIHAGGTYLVSSTMSNYSRKKDKHLNFQESRTKYMYIIVLPTCTYHIIVKNICILVGSCLVFIGNLSAMGRGWVVIK